MGKGKGGKGSSIYGMRLTRDRCPFSVMKDRREPGPFLPQSRFSHPSRVLSGENCGGGTEDGRRILALPPLPPALPRHRSPLLAEKHFPFQNSPIFFVLYFCIVKNLIRSPLDKDSAHVKDNIFHFHSPFCSGTHSHCSPGTSLFFW